MTTVAFFVFGVALYILWGGAGLVFIADRFYETSFRYIIGFCLWFIWLGIPFIIIEGVTG